MIFAKWHLVLVLAAYPIWAFSQGNNDLEHFKSEEKRLTYEVVKARIELVSLKNTADSLQKTGEKPDKFLEQRIRVAEEHLANVKREQQSVEEFLASLETGQPAKLIAPARQLQTYAPELQDLLTAVNYTNVYSGNRALTTQTAECVVNYLPGDNLVNSSIETEPLVLFSFTDPALLRYFSGKEMIAGVGSLAKNSADKGRYYLHLSMLLTSPKIAASQGDIGLGNVVDVNLLDGKTVRLLNSFGGAPLISNSGSMTYTCQLALGTQEQKMLKEAEVDSITIRWKNTVQTYPVYEVDFFRKTIACLEQQAASK